MSRGQRLDDGPNFPPKSASWSPISSQLLLNPLLAGALASVLSLELALAGVADGHPAEGVGVHLLHQVVGDVGAAVIFRWFPAECAG